MRRFAVVGSTPNALAASSTSVFLSKPVAQPKSWDSNADSTAGWVALELSECDASNAATTRSQSCLVFGLGLTRWTNVRGPGSCGDGESPVAAQPRQSFWLALPRPRRPLPHLGLDPAHWQAGARPDTSRSPPARPHGAW